MLRTTTKEILLTELSNRKPEEIRLSFAIGWMRAEEKLVVHKRRDFEAARGN